MVHRCCNAHRGVPRPAKRPHLVRAILCTMLASVCLADAFAEDTVEVRGERVNLYAEPHTTSRILARVSRGTSLVVLDRAEGWYRVAIPGSGVGMWLRATEAQPPAPA